MGDMRIAEAMIVAAAKAGVDIIKTQSFHAERLNPQWEDYENAKKRYTNLQLTRENHLHLMEVCKRNGVEYLSTAFDCDAADMLADLGLKMVKIASPDANNWELIEKCVARFASVIISTGIHTHDEVNLLIDYLRAHHPWRWITLLHCVSEYPTSLGSVSMDNMLTLRRKWAPGAGFSDHTLGTEAGKLAIALGADYLEKHFTLSNHLPGKDQEISGTPEEFAELVRWRNLVDTMMQPCERSTKLAHYKSRWKP